MFCIDTVECRLFRSHITVFPTPTLALPVVGSVEVPSGFLDRVKIVDAAGVARIPFCNGDNVKAAYVQTRSPWREQRRAHRTLA